MLLMNLQTNIIAILTLSTLFFSFRRQANRQELINKLFIALIFLNAVILVTDSVQVGTSGINTPWAVVFLQLSTCVYYMLNVVIPIIWMLYVDFHIRKDRRRIYRIVMISLPIILTYLIFTTLSIWGNYIYFINDQNVYSRGTFFWMVPLASFGYVIGTSLMIFLQRKIIKKNEYVPLLLFAVPPVIAGIIQIAIPGLTIIWPSMTISILIVYIYIQSRLTTTDYLTGLFNRREFENRLSMIEKVKGRSMHMGGIVCDIDDFKTINDRFGHSEGDIALIQMGDILKSCVRKDDFVARLGGDEFTVVAMNQDEKSLKDIVNRIKERLESFNQSKAYPFELNMSIGYDIYDIDAFETIEKFFIHLDHLMYAEKSSKKKR